MKIKIPNFKIPDIKKIFKRRRIISGNNSVNISAGGNINIQRPIKPSAPPAPPAPKNTRFFKNNIVEDYRYTEKDLLENITLSTLISGEDIENNVMKVEISEEQVQDILRRLAENERRKT